MMKKRLLSVAAVFLLVLLLGSAWIVFRPSSFQPLAWQPPVKPSLTGPLAPNTALRGAEIIGGGRLEGPEDADIDAQGWIYGGTHDGRVMRIDPGGRVEDFAHTGGRPLGMEFDAAGNLIVADAIQGLLSIDPQGRVRTLVDEAEGRRLAFTDDVDIAADGTIYFSDASWKYGYGEHLLDMLESRPYGRLLAHQPETGRTRVLSDGLFFANGVAVAPDQSFVLVNETYRYRIARFGLEGERAGRLDRFIDNLPCFPDGIASDRIGRFYVACFAPRKDIADTLLHPNPRLKKLMASLPAWMWPRPENYGLVLVLDIEGRIVASYHDPGGEHVRQITSAEPADGWLLLGTLRDSRLARWKLE